MISRRKIFVLAFLLSYLCLPCTICQADIAPLPPARTFIHQKPDEDMSTRSFDEHVKQLVEKKSIEVIFFNNQRGMTIYSGFGHGGNRIEYLVANPFRFIFAIRFPGPCEYSYTITDKDSGKILLQEHKSLSDMYFIPVNKCIKGRISNEKIDLIKHNAKKNNFSYNEFIEEINNNIDKNIDKKRKTINSNYYDNTCFNIAKLYDFREVTGKLNDSRVGQYDSIFTVIFDLDVKLLGYDFKNMWPTTNKSKNINKKLRYKISKNKNELTISEIFSDGSEKKIRETKIISSMQTITNQDKIIYQYNRNDRSRPYINVKDVPNNSRITIGTVRNAE